MIKIKYGRKINANLRFCRKIRYNILYVQEVNIVTYYMKWVKTSWTDSSNHNVNKQKLREFKQLKRYKTQIK